MNVILRNGTRRMIDEPRASVEAEAFIAWLRNGERLESLDTPVLQVYQDALTPDAATRLAHVASSG